MDEFELIRRFFDRPTSDSSVSVGVGDDGAVVAPESGRDLVTVIDTLVEDIHFPAAVSSYAVGFRSVAVNLSDIAAMGARPRWMTLALTLPQAEENWLNGFAHGLFDAADEHSVSLVGGDTTRGKQTVVSVQITGDIPRGQAIRRTGARLGDFIFVSGTIGDAAAGLSLIDISEANSKQQFLIDRFSKPTARVHLGQALIGIASAAIDLSDGLYSDIRKLLGSSDCGGRVEAESIPLSNELTSVFSDDEARSFALLGGDDYELCFTAAPGREQSISVIADQLGVALTCIGEVVGGGGLKITQNDDEIDFHDKGYTHF